MSNPSHRTGSRRGLPKEPEKVSKLDSGLLVVTKDEREAADEILTKYEELASEIGLKRRRILRWVGIRHHDVLDIDVKTEVNTAGPTHKLNPDERKQRRADNKKMAEIRNRKKRKKHGRS